MGIGGADEDARVDVEFVDADALGGLKDEWVRLFDEARCDNPFLSFEWADARCRHCGDGVRPLFAVARGEGRLAGVAPMEIASLLPFGAELRFLGSEHADYGGFLAAPLDRDRVIPSLVEALARRGGFDRIRLGSIPEPDPCLAVLRDAFSAVGRLTDDVVSWHQYVSLDGDYRSYMRGRSKNTRRYLRQAENRPQRDGVQVNYWSMGSLDPERLTSLFEIHVARHGSDGDISMFEHARVRDFVADLGGMLQKRGWLRVAGFDVGDEMAAGTLGVQLQGTFFCWILSLNPALVRYCPGNLLVMRLLEECWEAGLDTFDFMHGGESYKTKWATGQEPLHELVCYLPGHAAHHAAQAAAESSRRFLGGIKNRSPFLRALRRRMARLG